MMWLPLAFTLAQNDVEARMNAALPKLTLERKLQLIGGYQGFNIMPIPEINLPLVIMSDGPVGIRNFGATTAYPSGTTLASSFDPQLAYSFGESIGRDAIARKARIWLGPGVNLSRIVQNGRNFEYLGEDPYLAARSVVPIIKGAQSQGIVATVKHFVANNHEDDRNHDSSDVSERALRELYLRAFEAAVKEGNVGAVMCSYNLLNGTYTSENAWLLQKVLKQEWGFKYLVMSDWGAVHSTVGAATHGMDLEMPDGYFMNPRTLLPQIKAGTVTVDQIDDKVRRILRTIYTFHLDEKKSSKVRNDPRNTAVARRIAEEGTVLLKNTGVLPLSVSHAPRLLVVGPNALRPITGGGGSSYTNPLHSESLFAAVQRYFPKAVSDPAGQGEDRAFDFDGYKDLKVDYYAGKELAGESLATVSETKINHVWSESHPSPVGAFSFSARWTGFIAGQKPGKYRLVSKSDDGIRVYIDGKLVIDRWTDHAATYDSATITITNSDPLPIKVEYYQGTGDAIAQVGLIPNEKFYHDPVYEEKLNHADVVIAAVGFNPDVESEGIDRPFELPDQQKAMLNEAVASGKKLILVNYSGAGVNLAPWVGKASAVIQAWYPGQEGAAVLADILTGKVNPSGKLPTSFPQTLNGTYYAAAYPPVNHHVDYREDLLIGYRWFDAKKREPLFPFGFGLSYTSFAVHPLSVSVQNKVISVTADLKNIGQRTGADVVQVYVGSARTKPGYPVKELKAFKRVTLASGAKTVVHLSIPVKDLAHWDVGGHRWKVAPGQYVVYVGDSSRSVVSLPITVTQGFTYAP